MQVLGTRTMNVRTNHRMAAVYRQGDLPALPGNLEELLMGGFTSDESCVFLTRLFESKGNATREAFLDDIGYECFVNHLHFAGQSERELASVGLEFCRRAKSEWTKTGLSGDLQFVVSIKDNECTLRFHRVRNGFQWLDHDLNSYEEAILVCDTRPG
jgi:hypothetical protein